MPNMSSNDDRMAIRHNWDMLMPRKEGLAKRNGQVLTVGSWQWQHRNPRQGTTSHAREAHSRRSHPNRRPLRSLLDSRSPLRKSTSPYSPFPSRFPLPHQSTDIPIQLYYTLDTDHQLVVNGTFGFDGRRNYYHASHYFEYLRNQILCMADMSLEGSESVLDATGSGGGGRVD